MDARKDMASENKSRGLKYKIPRSYRKATSDLNFMSKVERGVPLKDVNAVRSSADGSTVQDFMPMELLQPKDVASEVAHKVDHGVGRSSWRTPSGTTVMTEGLRLSDMFKPGAKP